MLNHKIFQVFSKRCYYLCLQLFKIRTKLLNIWYKSFRKLIFKLYRVFPLNSSMIYILCRCLHFSKYHPSCSYRFVRITFSNIIRVLMAKFGLQIKKLLFIRDICAFGQVNALNIELCQPYCIFMICSKSFKVWL